MYSFLFSKGNFADFSQFNSSSSAAPSSNSSDLLADVFSSQNASTLQSQGSMSQPMGNMNPTPVGTGMMFTGMTSQPQVWELFRVNFFKYFAEFKKIYSF